MESFEIGLTLAFAVVLIINIKSVDWKSVKTYKVSVLTLLVPVIVYFSRRELAKKQVIK